MRHHHRLTVATIVLLSACTASAGTVYKSIDAQGRVTYSSTPPATAPEAMIEQVRIEPGPTKQQEQDATQRANALGIERRRAYETRQEQRAQPSTTTSDDSNRIPKSSSLGREDTARPRASRSATRERATRPGIER